MKLAVVNMQVELDKKANLEKHLAFLQQASQQGVELLVFPELSLNGYLWDLQRNPPAEEVQYFLKDAEAVPGPSTERLMAGAKGKKVFIVFGLAEVAGPGLVYDSSVLVGPQGQLAVHRKVHLIGDEVHIFKAGNSWQVWQLPFGRLGMLVCYDKTFPEGPRELVLAGAELLTVISAWVVGGRQPEGDFFGGLSDLFDRARAVENQCWLLSANQVGPAPRSDRLFYGNSKIVDPNGRVMAEAGSQEGLAMAEVDIQAGIFKARSRGVYVGTNLLKDRRPDTYTRIASHQIKGEDPCNM